MDHKSYSDLTPRILELAKMTEEAGYIEQELFTKYADCVREYQVMAECLLFQNSFRLGAKMMLEVMENK